MTTMLLLMMAVIVVTGIMDALHPSSNVEVIDPTTLHLHGEFVESNLGTAAEPDGSVTVRLIAEQYELVPNARGCAAVNARRDACGCRLLRCDGQLSMIRLEGQRSSGLMRHPRSAPFCRLEQQQQRQQREEDQAQQLEIVQV